MQVDPDAERLVRRIMVLTLSLGHALDHGDLSELPAILAERREAIEELATFPLNADTIQLLDEVQRHEQAALDRLVAENERLAHHLVQSFEQRRALRAYGAQRPRAAGVERHG